MVCRPKREHNSCFVIMPFGEPFDTFYRDKIAPAIGKAGLRPKRVDEVSGAAEPIIKQIWDNIWSARLVVADLTGKNANVSYELGLCHALGVDTILLTQASTMCLPITVIFDVYATGPTPTAWSR